MRIFPISTNDEPVSEKFKVQCMLGNIAIVGTDATTEIGVSGISMLKVIYGTFEIFGFLMTSDSAAVEVHSTKELTLKITPKGSRHKIPKTEAEQKTHLKSLNLLHDVRKDILDNFSSTSHVLLITSVESSDTFSTYLEKYVGHRIYSKEEQLDDFAISSVTHAPFKCNVIKIHQEWIGLGSRVTKETSRVVLCGGIGSGKSTLMKYLINRSLANHSAVLVLDFDPGQCEFTVMGCLSAVLVTKPAIGPNFSHIVTPVKSFYLGTSSPSNNSQLYFDCVTKIIELCLSTYGYRDIPWFVNTMGYTQGVDFMKHIIIQLQPTEVIQIQSKKKRDNFQNDLIPSFVSNNDRIIRQKLKYNFIKIPSVPKSNDVESSNYLNAPKKREAVALSYFFKILDPSDPVFITCVPIKFNLKNIRIVIVANETPSELSQVGKLSCLNGKMIALCSEEPCEQRLSLMECRGFALVRGVDLDFEEIYICTPLSAEELKQINVVHMNPAIQLPTSVYIEQRNDLIGVIPYLARTIKQSKLNQVVKKTSSRFKPYPQNCD